MKVTVSTRGIDELRRELGKLSAAVAGRLARNAALAGATVAARHAKLLAPVGESGDVRRSIRAMRDPNWRQSGERTALAGSKLFYAKFQELGTARQPARPFLRLCCGRSRR
jgi:HK97 gp10 family phage protein